MYNHIHNISLKSLEHSSKLVSVLTFLAPFELLGTWTETQKQFLRLASANIILKLKG
jgi:hypothetical protein